MSVPAGRARCARAIAGLLTLAVLATGCAGLRPLPRLIDGSEPVPCSTAAVRSCALPYPTDEFTVADPLSGTGRRVEYPQGLIPERLVSQLGPGATPQEVFRDADGFSALTPVIFELEHPINPASVPSDGGDVIAVFDEATGERIPVRAEVPVEAGRHGAPDTILVAWPRGRFQYATTYVARVMNSARTHSGAPLRKPIGLRDESRKEVRELREALRRIEGDRWSEVVSATRFTVRSAANATARLDRMAEIARAEDHPIRRVSVHPPLLVGPPFLIEHASAVVRGEVLISDFRDEHGVASAENGSTGRWVPFVLALPERPAGPEGAPVVIYGHGLTVAKETMVPMASMNAKLGLATIGIDVPNHGDRQSGFDGGYLLDLISPRRFGRVASLPLQGAVDHVSLLRAVQDHLGDLELELPTFPGVPARPAPRLDTSRILYQGTSMGGVLGATFTGMAPELGGSFVQVAGVGIADIIYHSLLWPLFMSLIPEGATTGDAYALMGSATMALDSADSVNVLDRIRAADTPFFLVYGIEDGIVPNSASERLVQLLDLPIVGRQIKPLRRLSLDQRESVDEDGWGVAQIWPGPPDGLRSFAAHGVGGELHAKKLLEQWLTARLAALGVAATP